MPRLPTMRPRASARARNPHCRSESTTLHGDHHPRRQHRPPAAGCCWPALWPLGVWPGAARAQFRVEITGVGAHAAADRRDALSRRSQVRPADRRHHARRPRAQRRVPHRRLGRRARRDLAARPSPSGAAAAPTRWCRARRHAWPTAASTCATSCGTWSRAQDLGGQAHGRGVGRSAAGRAPHRRRDVREAHRRQGRVFHPHRLRHAARPTATRCASPTPTARAARWRCNSRSRSSRRPGRPTARRWPTCRSKAARRWCGCRTWPPASAARSPTSAAATARRRGRPTARSWR